MLTFFGILIGVLCVVYSFIVFAAGSGTKFFLVWDAAGCLVILFTLIFRHGRWGRLPRALRVGVYTLLFACLLIIAAGISMIMKDFHAAGEPDLDYIIVLGAQVYEDGPSAVLQYRLDAAGEYLVKNPGTRCIVSGGQGENEPFTEAYGMKRYLIENGIPENRILVEDEAKNTTQNIEYSLPYIDPEVSGVGIVTNNFHVFRGCAIAGKAGIRHVCGIAADSAPLYLPNNMLRELLGIIKDTFAGNL